MLDRIIQLKNIKIDLGKWFGYLVRLILGQHIVNHVAVDIGQAALETIVIKR